MQNNNSKLNTILLIILILLVAAVIFLILSKKTPTENSIQVSEQENIPMNGQQEVSTGPSVDSNRSVLSQPQTINSNTKTYSYKKYGFSVDLPTGYTPKEVTSESGPKINITFPNGVLVIYSDSTWWDKFDSQIFTWVADKKISNAIFRVYEVKLENGISRSFWVKYGGKAYHYISNDSNNISKDYGSKDLETFKILE